MKTLEGRYATTQGTITVVSEGWRKGTYAMRAAGWNRRDVERVDAVALLHVLRAIRAGDACI